MRRKGYCLQNGLIMPLTSVLDRRITARPGAVERRVKVIRSEGQKTLSGKTTHTQENGCSLVVFVFSLYCECNVLENKQMLKHACSNTLHTQTYSANVLFAIEPNGNKRGYPNLIT